LADRQYSDYTLDLFYGVNVDRNVIKFVDNFAAVFQRLVAKDAALREEMMSSDRYKTAMEKDNLRKVGGLA
jgi:hypothetical protein